MSSMTTTSPVSTTRSWDWVCRSRCDYREYEPGEYATGERTHETQVCNHSDAAVGVRPGALRSGERGRYHQGWRSALALRHHGDQRDDAQGHGPHAHR